MGGMPWVLGSLESLFDQFFTASLYLGTLGYIVMQIIQLMRRSSRTERLLASLPMLLTVRKRPAECLVAWLGRL